jgi:hypothetical protein
MKLFITNKSEFDKQFDDSSRFQNTFREPLTSSQIHQRAFNKLKESIDIKHSIPLMLLTSYDKGEGVCLFNFVNKNQDIYYYEYTGTAS